MDQFSPYALHYVVLGVSLFAVAVLGPSIGRVGGKGRASDARPPK